MPYYSAGKVGDYEDGSRKVVVCGDKEVGVFRLEGEFYAWHNRCGHGAGPVCQGRMFKRVVEPVAEDGSVREMAYDDSELHIVCPWHGYEFSIKTGKHPGNARVGLRPAKLAIEDGEVYVVL